MRPNYHHWLPEHEDFLRKHWPTAVNTDYFTKRFNNTFGTEMPYRKLADRAKRMGLVKDARAIKKQRALYAKICIEKRGTDFNVRMRSRALSGLYFGGKHFTWKGKKRPDSARIAKGITPEVRARAQETRRKTIKREKLRLSWGLEQKTKLRLGAMPQWESYARWHLNRRYGYVFFRFDRNIYYTDETTRSAPTEEHYKTRGLSFLHIQERQELTNKPAY